MTKRGGYYRSLIVFSLFLIVIYSSLVHADYTSGQINDFNNDLSSGQSVPYNGANIQGDAQIGSDGTISGTNFEINKQHFSSGSKVKIEHGKIVSADKLIDDKGNDVRFGKDIERDVDGIRVGEAEEYRKDNVLANNIRNAEFGDDGSYSLGEVELLSVDNFVVNNGRDVEFRDGVFSVGSADSINVEKGVLIVVRQFEGDKFGFWVESAESVMVRCLTVWDVVRSGFTVYSEGTKINPSLDVSLNITDCSNQDSAFVAGQDAEVSIGEKEPIVYTVRQGNLSFEGDGFSESVWMEDYGTVIMDLYYGFGCMSINPVGVYYYNSKSDKRVDFGIRIPDYGSEYVLCVRKDVSQQFSDYDGIVDLVDGFVELYGVTDYLRYPLKGGDLAGLVLEEVYQGLHLPRTRMSYDNSLVFLDNVSVSVSYEADTTISLTTPSTYYQIKEEPIRGEVHTLVKIDSSLEKNELTDNIIRNYNGMIIANNLLLMDNVMVLPPGHDMITQILK